MRERTITTAPPPPRHPPTPSAPRLSPLPHFITLPCPTPLTAPPFRAQGEVAKDRFDEKGYVALPPCLWGTESELNDPVWLNGTVPMVSIKRNQNTHAGHFGEMASWQAC